MFFSSIKSKQIKIQHKGDHLISQCVLKVTPIKPTITPQPQPQHTFGKYFIAILKELPNKKFLMHMPKY